jgi:RimJ/RimL family protein N-acetyltransferase
MEAFPVKQKTSAYAAAPPEDKKASALPQISLVPPRLADHGAELRAIVSQPSVMSWVADGRVWDARRLERFFDHCATEEAQDVAGRENYYHVVMASGRCVGVVGIHPATYDIRERGNGFLTIFLSPHVSGRGVGPQAVADALADYWAHRPNAVVYVDIRTDNSPMLRVAEKLALTRCKAHRIRQKLYYRFAARR